jgi:aldose sugar dehydrogenase
MNTYQNTILFLIGLFYLTASCAEKGETLKTQTPDPFAVVTDKLTVKLDTLYRDFENPWGMTWLPDGRLLVTEKKGEILIFKDDKFTGQKLEGVPSVHNVNQAGLLDIATHPNYASNGWLYLAYVKDVPKGGALTIARAKLEGNRLVNLEELIVNLPGWDGGRHYGSRIVFDNEGFLYFSDGDKGARPENAQELTNPYGKIHRIHDDGRIPTDNPFVDVKGAVSSIWTYGNRNPQGMYFDKSTNRLWAVEHGPKGGDELNLIEKGKNYGWPTITYGINYDGTPITDQTEKEGMQQPVTYWVPSIATCGMVMVTSDKYPAWKGNFLVAGLASMKITRVNVDGVKYVGEEALFEKIGRVRQVAQSPEGFLYFVTEGTGLLVKLIPQS